MKPGWNIWLTKPEWAAHICMFSPSLDISEGFVLGLCNSGSPQAHPPCFVEPSDWAKQKAVRSGKLPTVIVSLIKIKQKHPFRTIVNIFNPIRKEPGLKRRLQGDHIATFQHLKRACGKEREGLYRWAENDRTWGNGFKVKGGVRFGFVSEGDGQWMLSIQLWMPHPWKSEARLDGALSNLIQGVASLPRAGVFGLKLQDL